MKIWLASLLLVCSVGASEISLYFSPLGGCTDAINSEIDRATNSIFVQAYSFSSTNIALHLVAARRRGVNVQAILDKRGNDNRFTAAPIISKAHIVTLIDGKHSIAHSKIMILDRSVVITGSFNFSRAAEFYNAENLVVIRDHELAERYLTNWVAHAQHSVASH